ncbi:unnamed protein product [Mytilus coruscus]|uniref:Uncharacterized protein n=1 Tax=Mytilus coruscus TaxID=42192 RepID=A0A6J8DFG0_MYTCO|nr:unnamed protein product [Mytilus coruscus]
MAANFSGNGDRERFLQRVKETVDDCFRLGTTDAIQKQMFDSIRKGNRRWRQKLPTYFKLATLNHISTIKEQGKDLDCLSDEIADLKIRVESQEQYSRRTSLRFHNVPVPVDNHGKILHPVNTDEIVLDIIRNKLNINIDLNEIGRSHVIGKARKGRSQVIVRFISYRMKHLVYSNKKELKGDTNGTFITENLSQYRTELVKTLADMKTKNQISAYWTADGRIFVKKSENSRKIIIQNWQDVGNLRPPLTRPVAYDNQPDNQPDSANQQSADHD